MHEYKSLIKSIALKLYSNKTNNDCCFLDKTPRYYHIIEELYDLFPNAKFVFLVRNPLSVFASMLDYNFKGDYVKFLNSKDRVEDLFTAPIEINKALKTKENCILVKYEDLIENAEQELIRVFNYLNIELPDKLGTYSVKNGFKDTFAVDEKSLKKHTKPSNAYLNSWEKSINTTQKKKLALDYIQLLNKKNNDYFSYDLNQIEANLISFKPKRRNFFKLSLDLLIKQENQLSNIHLLKKRIILKIRKQ